MPSGRKATSSIVIALPRRLPSRNCARDDGRVPKLIHEPVPSREARVAEGEYACTWAGPATERNRTLPHKSVCFVTATEDGD